MAQRPGGGSAASREGVVIEGSLSPVDLPEDYKIGDRLAVRLAKNGFGAVLEILAREKAPAAEGPVRAAR